ncbi:hypothetical protein CCMSSC00406_0007086 [Pleurotus cornucopiae]|uniref:Uncharacterized protein n=1 Tax=Pleurotus cornucopiae TaxID=5321 RepID=A0ACB7J5J0_PLECO|nr:hypothetical protein CCMSSC00406_0007086 [Pleurotus cornucopiae]
MTPHFALLAPPPDHHRCPVPRIPRARQIVPHHLKTHQCPQFLKDIRDLALLLAHNADPTHAQVLEVAAFRSAHVAQVEEEPPQIDAALVLEVKALELREHHREIKLMVITREDDDVREGRREGE